MAIHTPDITVDGAVVSFPFNVIDIVSSHNTVKSLRVLVPSPEYVYTGSASRSVTSLGSVMDNTIAHNIVSGGPIVVVAGIS